MTQELQIQIKNLTARDVELCELLWNDRTGRSIEQIILDLPRHQQPRAWTLQSMMMAEVIDQMTQDGDFTEAEAVIRRARG